MGEPGQESITPISGIFVLDPSGIPVFARYYQGSTDFSIELLGGFFSAIEIFVKTNLDGLLSDIGMTESRFFFDRTSSGFIVIIIVAGDEKNQLDPVTVSIVKELQETVNLCFDILTETAEKNLMDINLLIETLGKTIDTFILEANFEIIDVQSPDDDFYPSLRSEQVSEEAMDKIIERIKSITD